MDRVNPKTKVLDVRKNRFYAIGVSFEKGMTYARGSSRSFKDVVNGMRGLAFDLLITNAPEGSDTLHQLEHSLLGSENPQLIQT